MSSRDQLLPLVVTVAAFTVGAYFFVKQRKRTICFSDLQSLLLTEEGSDCIYLDYNGTTPINPLVLAAMLPFLTTHFGNPSSSHHFGRAPKLAVDEARKSVLSLIGKSSEPLESFWFTGCGTESDNLAIRIGIESDPKKRHVVTTNVEHPAIENCLKKLEDEGQISVTYVPVQSDGRVLAKDMIDAFQSDTVLVTVMLANNESGALMPVKEIAAACRKQGILCHTDAAQACGKVNLPALCGDVDMITVVGHKLGAPKGIAGLYVRQGVPVPTGGILLQGGGQEFGTRGGTENVPYIAGLGKAAELAVKDLDKNMKHMETMRSLLLENLQKELGTENVRPNGPDDPLLRLPNTLSVGLKNVQSGNLLRGIGDQVAASAGAACHSSGAGGSVSAVLRAMNVPMEFAQGTLRLSVGPTTSTEDIQRASEIIAGQAKLQWSMPKSQ